MANAIASQIIPVWAVVSFREKVILTKDYDLWRDGKWILPVDSVFLYYGFQFTFDGIEALVYPRNDDSNIINISFDYLRLI